MFQHMNRRHFVALTGVAMSSGCVSALPDSISEVGGTTLAVGESATFNEEIEVTVTDSMTTAEMELIFRDSLGGTRVDSYEAPSGGVLALFNLEVDNLDITEREAPSFNIGNYTTLEKKEDTIQMRGVNDIRVYGSGEGGFLPDGHSPSGYDTIETNGISGPVYPQSPVGTRPNLGPDESISGWVYGVIESEATPELRINLDGAVKTWVSKEG
jgi:hypothetical protein